ncbi:MAG: YigZ family protein [Clostridia bacterium]|nr:YigZ family protein [Clostridia bacterium]
MSSVLRPYKTLRAAALDEFIVNKSRFIGHAAPVQSEEEALRFLDSIRREFRDATHNCYAYTIGANMGVMRYSDDGEPGGTAGLPMMEVIKHQQVCNCCVVVTRYFGGILLGAGGLVRAYTQGCAIALKAAGVVVMEPTASYLCEVDYPLWDRVQYAMKALPVQLTDVSYAGAVSFTLLTRSRDAEEALAVLTRVTDGRAEILPEDERFAAWPEEGEGTN